MKKSKLNIKKQSPDFLTLLLRSYVVYSLLIVILLTAIFLATTYLLNNDNITWTGLDISNYEDLLKEKKYNELPIKTIAGKGFVQIYDYKSDLLFSSTSKNIKFTSGELDIMPDFKRKDVIEITEFTTKNNDKQLFIQLIPANTQNAGGQYLVLSESYKILQTNIHTNKNNLTLREYQILTNNANSDKKLLKYNFVANDNSTYMAVVYDTTLRHNKAPAYILTISVVAIIIIYLILLLIIVKYLMKLVRDPLYNLETGMYRFSIGNYNEKIKYEGTKEFESMTKSFNDMVEIVDAKQKENEKLQSEKNRLLAGLSHDLKTPITVIQGFAKALNDGIVEDPEEQRKYLDIIQDKSQYMASLINKMYDYSKLDHPDFSLKFEDVDIFEFTRQYFAAIYNDFELKGFNLDIDIPEEKQILKIDKEEFSRVYNNIIANFFRYTKPGATFKVKITKSQDSLFIYLCDSGIPIPSEYRQTIFDAFTVADPARNNKGTGLGLAIIHRIVTLHGASIELTEFEGFPNVFKIKFSINEK